MATVYRTNKTSNTAFRTFGVVQAWAIVENAIEHVAFQLTKNLGRRVLPEEIRYKNMYRNGTPESYDVTHFGFKSWIFAISAQFGTIFINHRILRNAFERSRKIQ